MPLAINAGDMLFAMAYRALFGGLESLPESSAALGRDVFSAATLRLMEGQHLDLDFEKRAQVSLQDYVAMVRGKTGAVMGAALGLGALCGGAGHERVLRLVEAGVQLGLAFQAIDDALAFWGDPARTGKAIGNDLARGKKSLPVVLAAERGLTMHLSGDRPLSETLIALEQADVRSAVETFAADRRSQAESLIERSGISESGLARLIELADLAVSRDS
jgi:geranylgeranyl diphosphate synthase type I